MTTTAEHNVEQYGRSPVHWALLKHQQPKKWTWVSKKLNKTHNLALESTHYYIATYCHRIAPSCDKYKNNIKQFLTSSNAYHQQYLLNCMSYTFAVYMHKCNLEPGCRVALSDGPGARLAQMGPLSHVPTIPECMQGSRRRQGSWVVIIGSRQVVGVSRWLSTLPHMRWMTCDLEHVVRHPPLHCD